MKFLQTGDSPFAAFGEVVLYRATMLYIVGYIPVFLILTNSIKSTHHITNVLWIMESK